MPESVISGNCLKITGVALTLKGRHLTLYKPFKVFTVNTDVVLGVT